VFSFRSSWCAEGKDLGLLQCEDVIPYQIGNGPYDRDCEKGYEGRAVVDDLEESEHYRKPPDEIVGDKDEPV
jgi:hypothetical protein